MMSGHRGLTFLLAVTSLFLYNVSGQTVIVEFYDSQITVNEGDHFNVRIVKSGLVDAPVVLIVEAQSDTSGDFVGNSQVARYDPLASGVISVTFTVTDDDVPEMAETYYLTLTPLDPSVLVGAKRTLAVTINANDDALGVFRIDEVSPIIVTEREYTTVTYLKVVREVSYFDSVTVNFMVNSSQPEAIPDLDLSPITGTVTFQAQQRDAEIALQIKLDDIPERDETFYVTLTSANGARVTGGSTQVIIEANDAAVNFTATQYRFEEGPGSKTMSVEVTRGLDGNGQASQLGSVSTEVSLRFEYKTDGENAATNSEDFTPSDSSTTLTFGPGETRKIISFLIIDDDIPEIEEYFTIRLFNIEGDAVLVDPSVATIIISANDNPSGILSFSGSSNGESPRIQINEDTYTTVSFTVFRFDGTFGEVSVDWAVTRDLGGSAPVTQDVGPDQGTITFNDGQNAASIQLTVVQDNDPEAAEMFVVNILPNSVRGDAKVEGVITAELLVEDNDNVYGTVEFGPGTDHRLVTTSSLRTLLLSLTRSGGRVSNLVANVSVSYEDSYEEREEGNIFVLSSQLVEMPEGQDPVEVTFDLLTSAFLAVGGEFKAAIESVGFENDPRLGYYNSPTIGFRQQISVFVDQAQANGETGFFNVTDQVVEEPAAGETLVGLLVSREGLNGQAIVRWSLSGDSVTSTDVTEMSGSVVLESGMSEVILTIGIKADDTPELTERITVTLDSIEPTDTQRLRSGATSINIDVLSNDNPGGVIQFSSSMADTYEVEEGGDAVQVTIERSGGTLEARSVQYTISPDGEEQFYGATNIISFLPGETQQRASVLARADGVPEVSARYTLALTPLGDPAAILGEKTSIAIIILGSDNPYGVIQFPTDPTIVSSGEGQAGEELTVTLAVLRSFGTAGRVTTSWTITPDGQTDLTPTSGTLVFEEGQGQADILLTVVNDDLSEGDEEFALQLAAPEGGAIAGVPMVATIIITENDNPVEFVDPVQYAIEPQILTLTIERQGRLDNEANVYYRTLDGSASQLEGDYQQIPSQQLVFAAGQSRIDIQVNILDDDVPEGNETFSVQLLDAGGNLIVTAASTATVAILANDEAFGVFSFGDPLTQQVEEGSTVFYDIVRARGNVGSVRVYWELRNLDGITAVTPGEDFSANAGYVDFAAQENQRPLSITPLADEEPEAGESFSLVLTGVEVLSEVPTSEESLASLASTNLMASVQVLASDDPYGLMAFSADSRELSVAEDFDPGEEDTTEATFTVERRQGTQNQIRVLWEIFSDKLGGDLPAVYDLLFIGQWASSMTDITSKRRTGTQTPVALFPGSVGQYVTVAAGQVPDMFDQTEGFTISAWVQPFPACDGHILAFTSTNATINYLSLKLTTSDSTSTIVLTLSSLTQTNQEITVQNVKKLDEGIWHHLAIALANTTVIFYVDGSLIETRTNFDTAVAGGQGEWIVGALPTGNDAYTGYLQDVRIFRRALDTSAVSELYLTAPYEDISPISGTLSYGDGVRSQTFGIASRQDIEEEGREVFAVIILAATGGAALSMADSRTTLSVLKSDNANGLFGFEGPCNPERAGYENMTIVCNVKRDRGDDGTVSVTFKVKQRIGIDLVDAASDFNQDRGTVVFLPGIRSQTFEILITDDNAPELDEVFEVSLTSAVSDDGLEGSTTTSGASLDPASMTSTFVVEENDYPYGLLQFSATPGEIPPPDVMILPVSVQPQVSVGEEGGLIQLVVVRAQGTLGDIQAEWRTKDLTALSEGKSPPDYVGGVGNIFIASGENYAQVNITVNDNSLPEAEKTFSVELVNPTGGAKLGVGATVMVTIEASDGAFGVLQFADQSLDAQGEEGIDNTYGEIPLEVSRLAGTIGEARVSWEVDETAGDETTSDIVNPTGVLTFVDGQSSGILTLQVRADTEPELDEIVTVRLTQAVTGQLGDPLKTTATVTILASDDPYGKFTVDPAFRPGRTDELNQDVKVRVQRVGGTYGTVEVDYVSLDSSETFSFLPGPVTRADTNDFQPSQGTVSFGPGQTTGEFTIRILDDDLPEQDESIFVILTSVRLVQGAQLSPVPDSPRLGIDSETYGQLIISSNDDASGRLSLSPTSLSVAESDTALQLYVVRSGGNFGEVSVTFSVIDGTAQYNSDYTTLSREVILASGETSKRVPVELMDDNWPELEETFRVQLTGPVTGGAVLGDDVIAEVTIEPSDDPNGVFGFVSVAQTVEEAEVAYTVEITVARTGGATGVVTVTWEATLNGASAADDISPSSGSLYFVTNDASHKITVSVLPDTLPEGSEDITIKLTSATNGGRIDTATDTFVLTIAPNDSPHGTVQLASDLYSVAESASDGKQTATVVRSGGVYGRLQVFFSTSVMTVVDLLAEQQGDVLDVFLGPYEGVPDLDGTLVDLQDTSDPLRTCATTCLLLSACASFLLNTPDDQPPTCEWYTSSVAYNFLTFQRDANYYSVDFDKVSEVTESQARDGEDFSALTRAWVFLEDGETTGELPLNLYNDDTPELEEMFNLRLDDVIVLDENNQISEDLPALGDTTQAVVIIATNDNAYGAFSIVKATGSDSGSDERVVEVVETDRLAVDLIVEREGGALGEVSVEWSVSTVDRTAIYGQDYIADGATLVFSVGQTRRVITLTILDDQIPEENEGLTVVLGNPSGGATLSTYDTIRVVILASDYVAGLLSFEQTSVLVDEGDQITAVVLRTDPGAGTVTADWSITGIGSTQAALGFSQISGTLSFLPGELRKEIQLTVLTDNTPEVNEEYSMTLTNIVTTDVSSSGAAELDPQRGTLLITVAASDEPHGVFQLGLTGDAVTVQEDVGTASVAVERKFGAIGTVRVLYSITEGALQAYGTTRSPASQGEDFASVNQGFIDMVDGQTSGVISITIVDDTIPEIDEVFLLKLESVTLIDSSGTSQPPRLETSAAQTEVVISANDGAQGIIEFAQDSQTVDVSEQGQDISLTVVRGEGTFGRVTVFFYSQPITESTVAGVDYRITDGELVFEEGESRKSIVITILDDLDPEPDETFDVILASPSNGAALGDKKRASVTILVNDNAGGTISFDTTDYIQLREATGEDLSGTKAEILILRGPGTYGAISVPFEVTSETGQFTGDVTPEAGTVAFADRQTTTVLVIESVNDDEPEVEEIFTLTLKQPTGEAILGNIVSRTVTVAASDAPYGMMELYTGGSRLTSYSVEETFSALEFDVVRSQGTLGEVTVDVTVYPATATATTDTSRVVLAPLTGTAPGASVIDWHHVLDSEAGGTTSFVVMLTSLPSDTQLASMLPANSGLGAGQSVIFKWQGQLTTLTTFTTDGATAAESFTSGGNTYLFVANSGREGARQVSSFLYRLSESGELEVIQGLATSGASDVTTFLNGGTRFLFVTNSLDDSSRSNINSYLYSWDATQGSFSTSPVQLISTMYAQAVDSVTIGVDNFLAVANYFDSITGSYETSSVIYRMMSDQTLIQHQQLPTQGAVSVVFTQAGNRQLLAIANNRQDVIDTPQDSAVYRWDEMAQAFVLHQTLSTSRVVKVTAVTTSVGTELLLFANSVGSSEIFYWDTSASQYVSAWTGGPFQSLRPLIFSQPNGDLDALGAAYIDRAEEPQIFQIAHVAEGSDFVPRRVTMTFEPGQTTLSTSVVTLTDETPEDTETFLVSLVTPMDGAELGPQASVTVEILSNDDAHGVIEFNEDSLALTIEELLDTDNTVQLNVVRRLGYYGHVIVAWQATGDHDGVGDITPLSGQVEFPNGNAVATITLTVRDDQEAEFDEVTYIQLTEIIDDGTTLDSKGAKLGDNTVAMITVLANDSPYGVVSWMQSAVTVQEPEGTDRQLEIAITRMQGLEQAIKIDYVTSIAATLPASSQATPGEDYVATMGNVIMAEGNSRVEVIITIKQDTIPEADETFLVNLTSVSFQNSDVDDSETAPSIALDGGVIQITITENDNAGGFVEFDVQTNIEGRLDVYEPYGEDTTIDLLVRRSVGLFGSIIVTWQADPVEATVADYDPASGTVELADQQETAVITITIKDDDIAEEMETFDVKLISVTGDAELGSATSVRVAILKNDSPTGLFRFATAEVETKESLTNDDPDGQARLVVERVLDTQGLVNVRWRLSAEAEPDFLPPLEDTLQFSQGEVEKAIVLQTRPDTILEGREEFIISLVSADNNADISSTEGDSTIVILPDAGASGTISVMTEYQNVLIGEPGESSPGYPGEVEIKVTRGQGIFGEVVITWAITPRDLSAFLQVEGSLKLLDLQQTGSIVLQTRDDSVPELQEDFVLQLNSASGGAVLSTLSGATTATVTFVASDYPHGLVQFLQPEVVEVSEDQTNVVVTVSRGYGLNGEIRVSYSTDADSATENVDFLPNAGTLTFTAGVDTQTITITILPDTLPEGPEDFHVTLTSVILQSDTNNYSEVDGLSRDMAPALGPLSTKTIRIDKNDNAEGTLHFSHENYEVLEESGTAPLTVMRSQGNYGRVTVRYVSQMLSATEDVDYLRAEGELVLEDGASEGLINITIKDDSDREQLETLKMIISDVTGGALLGAPSTATVTILKSDYPNGRFAFLDSDTISVPNPTTVQQQALFLERTDGLLGQQEVFWRIMGPNNADLPLADTADVSVLSDSGVEVTAGSFIWADGESGQRQLVIQIKAYTSWEVEKTFVVELYRVEGTPEGVGDGEVDPDLGKVSLKVDRFGDPNGVVDFAGDATTQREFLEPDGVSSTSVLFSVTRQTGTGVVGAIEIFWEVRPSDQDNPDVTPTSGSLLMAEGQRDGQIQIQILPDDIPELSETFSLVLVRVEGGATLGLDTSTFTIRYNDAPYGEVAVLPELQAVEVNAADMTRHVKVVVSRLLGTFGSVIVSYTVSYDVSATGISLDPTTSTVTLEEGVSEAVALVSINGDVFLSLGSTFTVRLTEVSLLDAAAAEPPVIQIGGSKTHVTVPSLAANTEISFASDIALVNEDDQTLTVTIKRSGTYGDITADWISGYSSTDIPTGVENGAVVPSLDNAVSMTHGQEEVEVTVQVAPEVNRTEAFVLRLRAPQTVVSGGARQASTNQMVRADPDGVIRFSEESLTPEASELEGQITLTLWRLYGSESEIAVYFQTLSDSATQSLDYQHYTSGVVNFKPLQTIATINVLIYQDNQPEERETFYISLTGVEKFPTPFEPVISPRISTMKYISTVTIKESNDAYGILSLSPTQTDVVESVTTVTLTVSRSAGTFGAISVTVRTVGGGESWTDQIVPDTSGGSDPDNIAQALGGRSSDLTAQGGLDYEILDTVIDFQAGEVEKRITVAILDDSTPEPEESILVYLTQPVGGARVATGTSDGNLKGFSDIRIEASDLSNGIIGFAENSQTVSADEDATPSQALLTLTRINNFIGEVTVNWKTKMTLTSTDQEDVELAMQLEVTAGSTVCPADNSQCDLVVGLLDDSVPEEEFTFVVILTSTMPDAQLNEDSLYATVTIAPSDDVRGLLMFSEDSRVIIVGESDLNTRLTVKRDQGQHYEVTVAYETRQMSDSVKVSGTTVYPALDNQDFRGQTGTLTFMPDVQDPEYIDISLTPVLASDNPLPKQFYVQLHTPTNQARVDPEAGLATIRIVKDEDVALWRVVGVSGQDPYADDAVIIDVVNELDMMAEDELSNDNLDLVEDVLTKVNEQGESRRLPTSVITSVRNLYCKLLDDSINDARVGRISLTSTVEQFSYVLVTGLPCDTTGAGNTVMESTECSAIRISSGRWTRSALTGKTFDLQLQDTLAAPNPLPEHQEDEDGTNDGCVDFSLLEYRSQTWFNTKDTDDSLLNDRAVGFAMKGRPSASTRNPVNFTIYTPDRRLAAKDARCMYFDEGAEKWVSPSGVCRVVNDLGDDDYVTCECYHMTIYAVAANTRDDDIVGYVVYFFIICFICMTCILLAVIVHHLFFSNPTFSACLHMHFLMAIFFTHVCFVIDAFLSEDELLAASGDNSECIAMSLFFHYFFLAQFMWIATQAINLWKIFVMNDEHTDRHYVIFFVIGWGVPVILVAIFYAVTYNIYKYHTDLNVATIYGDVNNNREICFITNEFAALGGLLAPVLVCLLVLALVTIKAYQITPQWRRYDDVYRGRANDKELPLLLLIYGTLSLTCVWAALHMIYGYLWLMVLFCIFDVILGLLVLILYAVIRNPLFASVFGPSKSSYSVSSEVSAYPLDQQLSYYSTAPPSVKGSHANLLNDAWESATEGGRSRMTVRRALPSQAYIDPPVAVISPAGTVSSASPDFDDLLFALKMGANKPGMRSLTPSDIVSGGSGSGSLSMREDDISQLSIVLDHYETKRIDIADTHL